MTVLFYAPEEHTEMLSELRRVPFAKTDDGYRFASWVYDLNNNEEKQEKLLNSTNGKKAAGYLDEARAELEEILVSEDDYLAWTVHKKESGGIAQYHKVLHDLSINLLMLTIDREIEDIEEEDHKDAQSYYTVQPRQESTASKQVLNRNNPFADVTIKSQQFFYKTADGGTETLFFDTNNIVEKADKNGRDMITMRPGFSVTKEHGVARKPTQKVTFSNSLTEPIVGDEDHIYIHID